MSTEEEIEELQDSIAKLQQYCRENYKFYPRICSTISQLRQQVKKLKAQLEQEEIDKQNAARKKKKGSFGHKNYILNR